MDRLSYLASEGIVEQDLFHGLANAIYTSNEVEDDDVTNEKSV